MKISALLLLMSFSFLGFSQTETDVKLWTGFNYQLKLNKRFTVNIAPEVRFNDTIKHINSLFPDLGVKFKLSKRFALKLGYRYSLRPGRNNKNRFNFDFNYGWNKKDFPLSISNRLRFQFAKTAISGKSESYLRDKIELSYNLSKIVDPFISYEMYFKFGKNEFRNTRYSIGLDWKINKHWSVSSFYIYQREIYVGNPSRDHIIGLSGKYKMKLKKKKKTARIE